MCNKGLHGSDVTKCHSPSVQYLDRALVSSQRNSRHNAAMPSPTINFRTNYKNRWVQLKRQKAQYANSEEDARI